MAATPPRPPTLRQLALELGVSHTAVSLALRGAPGASAELRARARALAAERGYGANPLLSAWMRDRRRHSAAIHRETIGFLAAFDPRRRRRHPFSNPLLRYLVGAEQAAAERGYALDLVDAEQVGPRPERLPDLLRARGIRAAIVATPPPPGIGALAPAGFHLVGIQRHAELGDAPTVMGDHYAFMQGALEVARAAGRRRIGFVSGADFGGVADHRRWRGAFLEDCSRRPARERVPILEWKIEGPGADETLLEWAERHRPEAIVSNQPHVPKTLAAAGWRVPEDVFFSLMGGAHHGWPGAFVPPHQVGVEALAFLVQQLEAGGRREAAPVALLVGPILRFTASA